MAKNKSVFVCQNCGAEAVKWIGRCPSCGEWNSYVEEVARKESTHSTSYKGSNNNPQKLSEITSMREERIDTQSAELNRILGGGLVPGSLVLIGGEPGIGKSTLALQVALKMKNQRTLYISGEESNQQIKLRADRLGIPNDNCQVLGETLLENILLHLEKQKPDIAVIDSVQTLYTEAIESSPGSVSQIRECTARLMRFAKETHTPLFLIGHINKEGTIAGPKVLEHIVDTVLQFEGDHHHVYRILRSAKNRFGSTAELGIFEMRGDGLREVTNPSEILITHSDESLSGVAVAATIDGIRPFLIEVQALVSSAVYATPQRSSTGFDLRRLSMLLAVLEKRAGFKLATKDVFLNIAGGIKVNDPAIDTAVIAAILSSNIDVATGKDTCMAGEVGLSGEIRPVNRIEQRISEAAKLGFSRIIVSKYNLKGLELKRYPIEVVGVAKVENLVRELFG
jgi:DNA repair protein RadA/Sms